MRDINGPTIWMIQAAGAGMIDNIIVLVERSFELQMD